MATEAATGGPDARDGRAVDAPPLDDVMLAMDVVDTLRHRQDLVTRELRAGERDDALLDRLRGIYAAQGIAVTDAILQEGVDALREERFVHRPPPASAATRWATLYVRRGRWLRRLGAALLVAVLAAGLWYGTVRAPERALERDVAAATAAVVAVAEGDAATARAQALSASAREALGQDDRAAARSALQELETLLTQLQRSYVLQIAQAPDTGVWRVPDVNTGARNYYVVVEAIGEDGERLALPIRSEETGEVRVVERWGLRVDEPTFERIRADKLDDGIVQDRIFGEKARGRLEPDYRIPTRGGAITEW
jgi:hypothetical protein